jgi:hypothetical protein
MRFSSKTFKRRSLKNKRKTRKQKQKQKQKQRGGSLFREIPKEAVVVNPIPWDE